MGKEYSITLVVGPGFPGHAAIEIRGPDQTTFAGLGPVKHKSPYSAGQYDVITLPIGTSPVGRLRDPQDEYSFVDASQYPVKSYTFEVSREQAERAREAALSFRNNYPKYNVFTSVCTDYALSVLHAALPSTDLSLLSRVPSVLQRQLDEASQNGSDITIPVDDETDYKYKTYLPPFKADSNPPKFSAPPPPVPPGPPAYEPGAVHSPHGEFMGQFSDRSSDTAIGRQRTAAEPSDWGRPRLGAYDTSSRSASPASQDATGSVQQQLRPLGLPPTFDVRPAGSASKAEAPLAPPSAPPASVVAPVALRQPLPGSGFARQVESGPSWFKDYFHDQSAGAANTEMPRSPLLREPARVRDAVTAGAWPSPLGIASVLFPVGQRPSSDLADDGSGLGASATAPIRILRSRPQGQLASASASPAAIASDQLQLMNPMSSFADRFGNWASIGKESALSSDYQRLLLAPQSWRSEEASIGNVAPDRSSALPALGEAIPGFEDWIFPWARRSPWEAGQ